MRFFSVNDFLFILAATRWTILLSLLAFALGGLLGVLVAVLRSRGSHPCGSRLPATSSCSRARRC